MITTLLKTKIAVLTVSVLCLFAVTQVNAQAQTMDANTFEMKMKLQKIRPGLQVDSISKSDFSDLYEVILNDGSTMFVNQSVERVIIGDLYGVENNQVTNLTEANRDSKRKVKIESVDVKDMIVFPAKKETKAVMYVFTDIDCGYCQKLHREVPQLNVMGIEVRYLGFPRAGINSGSHKKLATAWCDDDQQATLTKLKNRTPVPNKSCDDPVAEQYKLGKNIGIRGTPAIITESGKLIPGYRPAASMAAALGVK